MSCRSGEESGTGSDRLPLKVFITVDVELWPRSWDSYREDFPLAFRRYILGETARGSVGLPFQLQMARDHELRFTFFVESLFACELGGRPLADIVALITEAKQDIQLHAHPEWVRFASRPIVATQGRYLFSQFALDEQIQLIDVARASLVEAGATGLRAFRAGSFAANRDTLAAVASSSLDIDSSFKQGSKFGRAAVAELEPLPGVRVMEYPLSTYSCWPGRERHLQLTACSFQEIVFVLESAWRHQWEAVVLLSHSAELLSRDRARPDRVVLKRFEKLCRWLAERKSRFVTCALGDEPLKASPELRLASPIQSGVLRTLRRIGEQALRRL